MVNILDVSLCFVPTRIQRHHQRFALAFCLCTRTYAGLISDALPNSFNSASCSNRHRETISGKEIRREWVPQPLIWNQPLHGETEDEVFQTARRARVTSQSWVKLNHTRVRNWNPEQRKALEKGRSWGSLPAVPTKGQALTQGSSQEPPGRGLRRFISWKRDSGRFEPRGLSSKSFAMRWQYPLPSWPCLSQPFYTRL